MVTFHEFLRGEAKFARPRCTDKRRWIRTASGPRDPQGRHTRFLRWMRKAALLGGLSGQNSASVGANNL